MVRADRRRHERLIRRRLITRVIILSFIVLSVSLIFISRSNDARFSPIRNGLESASGTLIHIINMPIKGMRSFGGNFTNLRQVHSDNKRLKGENAELRQYKFRSRALKAKLDNLESILNVESGLDIPEDRITLRVISESNGPFAYSVLLNGGQSAGVKVGHPVMHESGLIGHVIRVGKRTSRILLLKDLNSRVSVMVLETGEKAVLIGKNDDAPQLAFYDNASNWKDGQEIVTSGDDGILPRGLPIGYVVKLSKSDVRVALIPRRNLDWVWVYPYMPILEPEETQNHVSFTKDSNDLDENIQVD
ncbi:MAG: rod shape-determining protein MreC [Maricaulaceae bacterium]